MTALRWITGSARKRASAARVTNGSGASSTSAHVRELGARLGEPAAVALQEVERGVVRDAKQPRPQRRQLVGEREPERVERLRERVLHDVLALDHRAGEPRAVAMQLGPDGGDHREELVARAGDGGVGVAFGRHG